MNSDDDETLSDTDFLTDSDGEVPLLPPLDRELARRQHRERVERWRREPWTDPHMQQWFPAPAARNRRVRTQTRRYSPTQMHRVQGVIVLPSTNPIETQERIMDALAGDLFDCVECKFEAVQRRNGSHELRISYFAGLRETAQAARSADATLRSKLERVCSGLVN